MIDISSNNRLPSVEGSFYPSDKDLLKKEISLYFNQTKLLEPKKELKILIVPHAGIVYSGHVASCGFAQINRKINKVILLGVSHYSPFNYAAIYEKGYWQTPLGKKIGRAHV